MRRPAAPVLAVLLALLLAPAASAVYAPQLYFLAPPTDDPLEGGLATEQPTGNVSASVLVAALPADAASATFVAPGAPNATHVLGRVLVGLWTDAGLAAGSVEARFVLVDADGAVTTVGQAAQPVSTDPSQAPEPTALLPPDPTDPQGSVFHVAMQAMPLLQKPPVMLDLGILDAEIPEGSVAGVELRLVEDNATGAPASGVVRVSYDAALAPSFLYVPWWDEDAAAESGGAGGGAGGGSAGTGGSDSMPGGGSMGSGGSTAPDDTDGSDPSPEDAESPGAPFWLLLVGLSVAVALRRRR